MNAPAVDPSGSPSPSCPSRSVGWTRFPRHALRRVVCRPREASASWLKSLSVTIAICAFATPPVALARTSTGVHRQRSPQACHPAERIGSPGAVRAYQQKVSLQRRRIVQARSLLQRHRSAGRRAHSHHQGTTRATRARLRRLLRAMACEDHVVTRVAARPPESPPKTLEAPSTTPSLKGAASAGSAITEPPGSEITEPPDSEASPPPTSDRGLSIMVNGNEFINQLDQDVTLHGVNIMGTQWQCLVGSAFSGPSNEASVEAIASWHVNVVRIPLNEDCWLGINGAPARTAIYHEELRRYVDRLHAHGLYAILDLHWSAPGTTLSHIGPGFAGFYEMADREHAPAFWASLASYFADDHAVLFDLYNEPNNISWSCWRNGCSAPRDYETAGMQELIEAIRDAGATQPVMVGGLELAGQLGQEWLENRPVDPQGQLVASAHVYGYTNAGKLDRNIGVVARRFPVVLGEAGESNCADNDLQVLLPWADEYGVSYLAWAWYIGECASYSLISDYGGTPTDYGLGYREHLIANFPAPSP